MWKSLSALVSLKTIFGKIEEIVKSPPNVDTPEIANPFAVRIPTTSAPAGLVRNLLTLP